MRPPVTRRCRGIDGELGNLNGIFRALVGVEEIDEKVRILCIRREGVLVEAGAFGGSKLGADVGVLEQHGVVAGLGGFVIVRKARAIAGLGILACAGLELDLAGARHHEDVEQVAAAGAAEMGVGEAHDGGVAAVVAGAPVPAVVVGIRAELDGAEGNGGAGEAVAVAAGADDEVDVAGDVVLSGGIGGRQKAFEKPRGRARPEQAASESVPRNVGV